MARVERKAAPSNCLSLRFDIDVLVEPALLPVVEALLGVLAEILLLLLLLPPLLPAADVESAAMLMVMVFVWRMTVRIRALFGRQREETKIVAGEGVTCPV